MEKKIAKTKKVRAFAIIEGDTIIGGYNMELVVKKIRELDKEALTFDFESGGFGVYQRRNFVNKKIRQ